MILYGSKCYYVKVLNFQHVRLGINGWIGASQRQQGKKSKSKSRECPSCAAGGWRYAKLAG